MSLRALVVRTLVSSLLLTSCSSLREVAVPPPEATMQQVPDIKAGDHVVVIRKNGKEARFEVTSVGTTAIYGKDLAIPYADIESMRIHKFNGKRTALLIVGTVVVAAAAFYGALVYALSHEED